MKKAQVLAAIHKASQETSRLMSAHLRSEAHASNWPIHIVRGMGVTYSKSGFESHVSEEHHAEALNYEYGTPNTQPTAAVRRSGNRTAEAENFFISRLGALLEDAI